MSLSPTNLLGGLSQWISWSLKKHQKKTVVLALLVYYWLKRYFRARKSVRQKVVLITGGGSGLGKQLARRFAQLQARVVLWDINKAAVERVATELTQTCGGHLFAYDCDVSSRDDVFAVAQRVTEDVGKVDILINNAGVVSGDWITDLSQAQVERTFGVNVLAHFWTIQAFLPDMMQANDGHVVTIASAAALGGVPKLTDYCASKSAALALDESLRVELARRGLNNVHTTCICPFYINTGMFLGAKSKWPFLLPILSEAYASDKILHAILVNEDYLPMPALLHVVPLIRFLLPPAGQDWVAQFLGITESMDDFKGRNAIENGSGRTLNSH